MNQVSFIPLLFSLLAFSPSPAQGGGAPRVAASIKPIHSLVAGVMKGAGEPVLIVRGGASPHTYSLRPSGMRALQSARLVFWVGGELEVFLRKPLASLSGGARAVALSRAKGMFLLSGGRDRAGDHHDEHAGGKGHGHGGNKAHEAEDAHGHGDHGEADMHIWLDPVNARRMVGVIEAELSRADEGRAALYRANALRLKRKLEALESEIRALLKPVAGVPYIVFHDAYRYFESRFGLSPLGSLTLSPERSPGAKRLAAIRRKIRALGARCVFAEPQFTPRLVETVAAGSGARVGELDPLGADLTAGEEMYFSLMRGLASSLTNCLSLK